MHYLVSVPLNPNLASFIGKRSEGESSLLFYNRKMDDNVIVGLAPSDLEMKFYGLAESMLMARQIVISTENVDRSLGEVLVAASLLDKHVIITDDNDIKNVLSGTTLKDFEFSSKAELLDKIIKNKNNSAGDTVRIDIDQAFDVKGIGTVVLGIVTSGIVKAHDNLYHSSGKVVNIKSIQSQDVNIDHAEPETRVGFALKGIEADEIDKGDILSAKAIPKVGRVKAVLKMSTFITETLNTPKRYRFTSNFSDTEAQVKTEGNMAVISFEKPVPLAKGDAFLLIRSNMPRIFASGVVEETIPA